MGVFPFHGTGIFSRPRLALVAALFLGLAACDAEDGGEQAAGAGAPPPPSVQLMTTELTTTEVYEDYAGRVRGAREVEVRARVEGVLERRLYDEGQFVEEGASLFLIDPEPFAVGLQGAQAEQETAEAELRQAEREWERVSRLFERNAISERERDVALSALELAQARLSVAESRVDQAALQLGYTAVSAPVAGVTTLEALPEGSLVQPGTLLTTVIQQDPVHVRFALPERDAALQRAARHAMAGGGNGATRRGASLIFPDGEVYDTTGEIDFTASTIDPRTGTVSARAIFPNPDNMIVPGQFVRVRSLIQTLEDVVLVPEVAVSEGPLGAQVFVVDENNVAEARPVTLGPVVPEGQVILEGLEGGERIIVNGQVAVQNGMEVAPEAASEEETS